MIICAGVFDYFAAQKLYFNYTSVYFARCTLFIQCNVLNIASWFYKKWGANTPLSKQKTILIIYSGLWTGYDDCCMAQSIWL